MSIRLRARLVAALCLSSLLGSLSCGGSITEPVVTAPIQVALTITPTSPLPGGTVTVSATATPPQGQSIHQLRLQLGGAATFVDSVTASGSGSVTITRDVLLPLATGTVTVAAVADGSSGTRGSNETSLSLTDPVAPQATVQTTPAAGVSLQPGDTLRVQATASDAVGIRYLVIRVTGALSRTDSVAYTTQTRFASRTLAVPVPSNAPLNGAVAVAIETGDVGGNVVRLTGASFAIMDLVPPTVTAAVTNARANGAFLPGDTATLALSAADNRALRAYGFAINGVSVDSVAASGTSAQRTVRIPLTTAGRYAVTAFAVDSAGLRTSSQVALLTAASRARRAVATLPVGGVYDIAYDARRGVVYLSQPDSNAIAVVTADGASRLASMSVASRPTGIDVTPGGDSLVIAQGAALTLAFRNLATSTTTTEQVIFDTFLDRRPRNVRVASNGRVVLNATFSGSGYGGSLLEFDPATRKVGASATTTESVPLGASGNRQRVYALIDDSCCPEDGIYYDASLARFTGSKGVVSSYFAGVAADFSGQHALYGTNFVDASLTLVRSLAGNGALTNPVALSGDGLSAFFATTTGIVRVRTSDGTALESFTLGYQPTHMRVLDDGVTLVATSATSVSIIDLW